MPGLPGRREDQEVTPEAARRAAKVAGYVSARLHVITNALRNHVEHMEKAAEVAETAYAAGQADPDVKAAQDASYITNKGLRTSAEMFRQDAHKARQVMEELEDMVEKYEEVVW